MAKVKGRLLVFPIDFPYCKPQSVQTVKRTFGFAQHSEQINSKETSLYLRRLIK
jgi:hypothetical protein